MAEPIELIKQALADRYLIEREIGRGGMAVVYLAEDLRHQRKVALKVLRPELSAVLGGDRFLQEIRIVARLQHPHVLPLFDSGSADGLLFYVMPYVEGESLRLSLTRERQLGVEEAIRITSQVAGALDYAHRHGVVHRDIKPENILLAEGQALVADFGIALAVSSAAGDRLTDSGLSLGTPQYMSPEQATGERNLDGRTDIYSLGCVLYEMLAGEPPHTGPTAQVVVARVTTEKPRHIAEVRETVPVRMAAAVHQALAKLPADRFAHAADFAAALLRARETTDKTGVSGDSVAESLRSGGMWLRRHPVASVVAATFVVVAGAMLPRLTIGAAGSEEPVYFKFDVPAQQLSGGIFPLFTLSADGKALVYGAAGGLRMRRLDSFDDTPIPGSAGALTPSFSPDGLWLLVTQGGLKKLTIHEGSSVAVAQQTAVLGASWGEDDRILLAAQPTGRYLRRVSAEGGAITRMTCAGDTAPANAYAWPQILPGGDAVLFTAVGLSGSAADSRILVLDLRTDQCRTVLERGMHGRYVRSGGSEYLLYAQANGTVLAAPFNIRRRRITGPSFAVLSDVEVAVYNGAALFAVADNGTLAFVRGTSTNLNLLKWVDRTGRELGQLGPPVTIGGGNLPSLSRDGARVVFTKRTPGNNNLWLLETYGGPPKRLTFDPAEDETAVWSADGRSIMYASARDDGVSSVYLKSIEGPGDPRLVYRGKEHLHLTSWSRDGQWLLASELEASDLYALRADGKEFLPVAATPNAAQGAGVFSPDGRWIAFTSNETGRSEVYVLSFPQLTGKQQVSAEGGANPSWAADGNTLYYQQGRRLMAAAVSFQPAFSWSSPRPLFEFKTDFSAFQVTPDGKRVLLLVRNPEAERAEIHVVLNWFTELRQREKAAPR